MLICAAHEYIHIHICTYTHMLICPAHTYIYMYICTYVYTPHIKLSLVCTSYAVYVAVLVSHMHNGNTVGGIHWISSLHERPERNVEEKEGGRQCGSQEWLRK